ncbi:hypothetical protein ACFW5W_33260 [Streptomyces sp. NPDC058783]|uniref:hypothetical protein n=1 Tax=unclassified Streptomyces TaxID=2593676 RepID=UPI0026EA52C5|nr:hypothetical protein [Streptomyces sp. HUAS CX7]WKX23642.1 hypothetical protein Q3Y68_36755 [Streptomyces sp. HUAS CX7]
MTAYRVALTATTAADFSLSLLFSLYSATASPRPELSAEHTSIVTADDVTWGG